MQLMEAFIFLIRTLFGLYITILLLRLLFQLVRADFYNPISQAIVKLTTPLVIPLRRLLPAMGRIDTASLLLAIGFQALLVYIIFLLRNFPVPVLDIILWSILAMLHRILDIFTFALFIVVILSWVAPYSRSPVALLAFQLTEPLLRPVRGKIPPVAGIDFSVMIVMLMLYVIANFLIPGVPV
jgi:YggT family protein